MSFHIDYSFILGQTTKTSALRDIYQLEIMGEEKDLDVSKCGIFTAVFDSRKITSVTLLQSAIFCSRIEIFFFCCAFSLHQEKKHIKKLAFKNTMPVAQ